MFRSKTETVFRAFAAAIFWRISWLPNLARPLHVERVTSTLLFFTTVTLHCATSPGSWRSDSQVIFSEQDAATMINEANRHRKCPAGTEKDSCYDQQTGTYRLHPRPF